MASRTVNFLKYLRFTALIDAAFVCACAGCGCNVATGHGFCAICTADLPRVVAPCARCGLPTPSARCPNVANAWHVAGVTAPLVYSSPVDLYVRALKYSDRRALGRALALAIVTTVASERQSIDALVPVPLHAARHRQRGYNQADEIARTLGGALGLPVLRRGITRRMPTAAQTAATAAERRANVAHAFAVKRPLRGMRLAIVDDVVTTGATVNALAAALLQAGAARCTVWAVARTLESSGNQVRNA
jgi:ComF family protein